MRPTSEHHHWGRNPEMIHMMKELLIQEEPSCECQWLSFCYRRGQIEKEGNSSHLGSREPAC